MGFYGMLLRVAVEQGILLSLKHEALNSTPDAKPELGSIPPDSNCPYTLTWMGGWVAKYLEDLLRLYRCAKLG